MRERLSFALISKAILDNRNAGGFSNVGYYEILFDEACSRAGYGIPESDSGNVSKIIKGERKLPDDVVAACKTSEGVEGLKAGVHKILEEISDPDYLREEIMRLVSNADGMSRAKKKKLLKEDLPLEELLAESLLYSISRRFEKSSKKSKQFDLSDFLLDYHLPSVGRVFAGRDDELAEIHKRLSEEDCLFLSGIGGIGKSEIARQYAKAHKRDYNHIIYLRYDVGLRRTISGLTFHDDTPDMDEAARFEEHYRFFKLLGKDALVILDNFNTLPENEELFRNFLDLSFRLLVTTKSPMENFPCLAIEEISSNEDLKKIFYAHAPESRNAPIVVERIIAEVHRHTLAVELAAKTIAASGLPAEDILSALQEEGLRISNEDTIVVTKDADTKRAPLYGHIETLFRLQKLSEEETYYLRHMLLMPAGGIKKRLFRKWMQATELNCVNDLVRYGWIQEDTENAKISMHPFLHEVVLTIAEPTRENCPKLIQNVLLECVSFGQDIAHYQDVIRTIESINHHIPFQDSEDLGSFIDKTRIALEKYSGYDSQEQARVANATREYLSSKLESHKTSFNEDTITQSLVAAMFSGIFGEDENAMPEVLSILDKAKQGSEHAPMLPDIYNTLGTLAAVDGNTAAAIDYLKESHGLMSESLPPDSKHIKIAEVLIESLKTGNPPMV